MLCRFCRIPERNGHGQTGGQTDRQTGRQIAISISRVNVLMCDKKVFRSRIYTPITKTEIKLEIIF